MYLWVSCGWKVKRRMSLIAGYNMIPDTRDLMKLSSCFMKYSGAFLC